MPAPVQPVKSWVTARVARSKSWWHILWDYVNFGSAPTSQKAWKICDCLEGEAPLSITNLQGSCQPDLLAFQGALALRVITLHGPIYYIPLSILDTDVQTVTMETPQCQGEPVYHATAVAMLILWRLATVTLSRGNA